MAQGRAFRPSKTSWLDRNQIRERLEFKNVIFGGRYWDQTSDHIDHVPQLVEIPTWFLIYTKWQIFFKLDTKELTGSL